MEIYIVSVMGDGEMYYDTPYKAFTDIDEAQRFVCENNDEMAKLCAKFELIQETEISDILEELFAKFLKDQVPNIYADIDKYQSNTNDDELDWQTYDNLENEFYNDTILLEKYARDNGYEQMLDSINTFVEYKNTCLCNGHLPFYYVVIPSIELVERTK